MVFRVFRLMRAGKRPTVMKNAAGRPIDVEAFYARYGPMVLRRCRRMLGDEQSAYDAMQEVFLKVLINRESLSGDHPSALLFRIATNTCLNKIRDDRKHKSSEYLDVLAKGPSSNRPEHGISSGRLLADFLLEEKGPAREIAVMYFLNGMTLKEIGSVVQLSVSGVHKHVDKLRRKIRGKGEIG